MVPQVIGLWPKLSGSRRLWAPVIGHLGVVQKGVAEAEVEDQGLNRRSQQFIDRSFAPFLRDGWLAHVEQGVARVVFKHQAGFGHGISSAY